MCVEVRVGEPMELVVDASAIDRSDVSKLDVSVTGPTGDRVSADVKPDRADHMYRCSYSPVSQGMHSGQPVKAGIVRPADECCRWHCVELWLSCAGAGCDVMLLKP